MRSLLAISFIGIQSAIRSRVVIVLLAFMLLAIFGLPLTIKGDGTIQGQVQIMLGYTLSVIRFVLGVATVWAGCAAISTEIQDRQIQLIGCKPVRRGAIWAGKWLGLLWVNAFLLLVCGLLLYAIASWSLRPPRVSPEDAQVLKQELLVALEARMPIPDDFGGQVAALVDAQMASGQLPANARRSEVERAIRTGLLARSHTVPPEEERAWEFAPPRLTSDRPVLIRARFASSQIAPSAIPAEWTVRCGESTHAFTATNAPNASFTFALPSGLIQPGLPVTLSYRNASQDGSSAIFAPNEGIKLLVHRGGFAANLFRSLLVIFAQLAFLAAVGVTAGTLFSLPVAALFAGYTLLLIQSAPYIESIATRGGSIMADGGRLAILDLVLRPIFQLTNFLVAPLRGADPLHLLVQGLEVGWPTIGSEFLIRVVLYSGAAGLLATWVFNRRELALPNQ